MLLPSFIQYLQCGLPALRKFTIAPPVWLRQARARSSARGRIASYQRRPADPAAQPHWAHPKKTRQKNIPGKHLDNISWKMKILGNESPGKRKPWETKSPAQRRGFRGIRPVWPEAASGSALGELNR